MNLSRSARHACELAMRMACSSFPSTEYLLKALLDDQEVRLTLDRQGLLDQARERCDQIQDHSHLSPFRFADLDYRSTLGRAIQYGMERARTENEKLTYPIHLLLALDNKSLGAGYQMLADLGFDFIEAAQKRHKFQINLFRQTQAATFQSA